VRVKVELPKGLKLTVENERALLEALARQQARAVRMRAITQRGSTLEPLPRPKAGGLAWHDSGALIASIGVVSRLRRGRPEAIVRPLGNRTGRDFTAAKRRARERTQQLRAAAVLGAVLQSVGSASSGAAGTASRPARKLRLSKIRRRAVTDNAGLAAVLSTPDPRPNHRKRVWKVMGATSDEINDIQTSARREIRVVLEETSR
jgi:hypothetical protein